MLPIKEKAAKILANAQVVTLASIDENGFPRPVPMAKLGVVDGSIFMATGTHSLKTGHFKANPKAGISILEGGDSIVYTGTIDIVADESVKRSLWSDWMLEHFPGGADDPEYCVLKFTAQASTYWIDNEFVRE